MRSERDTGSKGVQFSTDLREREREEFVLSVVFGLKCNYWLLEGMFENDMI